MDQSYVGTPPHDTSSETIQRNAAYFDDVFVSRFSFAPTTQTTTVVTTKTVSTDFPPLLLRKPRRRLSDYDPFTFPLRDVPTPSSLQNFSFEINGRLANFRESADPSKSLIELNDVIDKLKSSGGNVETIQVVRRTEPPLGLQKGQMSTSMDSRKRQASYNGPGRSTSPSNKRRQIIGSRASGAGLEGTEPAAPRPIRPLIRPNELLVKDGMLQGSPHSSVPPFQPGTLDKGEEPTALSHNEVSSPQSLSLPSPSLSPISAAVDNRSVEHPFNSGGGETSRHSSAQAASSLLTGDSTKGSTVTSIGDYRQAVQMMEIPTILDTFDELPQNVQSYLMYQLLKRSSKATLQIVAGVVNPALKRDFLDLLPYELSLRVLSFLDVRSLCRAARVSRKWRQIVDEDEITWKNRLDQDDYRIEDGELERAIREGWGLQRTGRRISSSADTSFRLSTNARDGKSHPYPANLKSNRMAQEYVKDHFEQMVIGGLKQPLVGQLLYKAIYRHHHVLRKRWMSPDVTPRLLSFPSHGRNVVTCLQLDEDKVITGSEDTCINIFDINSGTLRQCLQGHEGGVWALQYVGNTLVSGSTDRTVRVWDIETGECRQLFEGHTSTVRCLQILPTVHADGNVDHDHPLIVTGSRDATLRVWRLPKPDDPIYPPVAVVPSSPSADGDVADANPYFVRTLTGHANSVRAIAGEGDVLASGSYDCTVRIWRVSTGACVWRLTGHTEKVYSVVLDSKRNRCISGSMDWKVKVWDLATGTGLWNLEGHSSLVGLLSLTQDRLVSAAADSTLRIWDADTGECESSLTSHTGAITCFQHDGDKVISGSDGTLKLWDVRTGKYVRDLLTNLSFVWQVRFDERRCVAAVQRDAVTHIEVLDFAQSEPEPDADRRRRR